MARKHEGPASWLIAGTVLAAAIGAATPTLAWRGAVFHRPEVDTPAAWCKAEARVYMSGVRSSRSHIRKQLYRDCMHRL